MADVRKFSFSPNEAARLMNFGEKSENNQIIFCINNVFRSII